MVHAARTDDEPLELRDDSGEAMIALVPSCPRLAATDGGLLIGRLGDSVVLANDPTQDLVLVVALDVATRVPDVRPFFLERLDVLDRGSLIRRVRERDFEVFAFDREVGGLEDVPRVRLRGLERNPRLELRPEEVDQPSCGPARYRVSRPTRVILLFGKGKGASIQLAQW